MLQTRKSPGFTLVELLMIIAIIGILASVILTSVNSSRMKAKDALVKSSIIQATVSIEKYFESSNFNGDLTCNATTCGSDTYANESVEKKEIADISKYINSMVTGSGLWVVSGSGGYQVFSRLPSTKNINTNGIDLIWFCADSTGKTGMTACENGGTPLEGSSCIESTDGADHANCPSDTK